MHILKAGTTLYHGTDNPDFVEGPSNPHPYSWFSTSYAVAERFAKRSGGWGGVQRVIEYCVIGDIALHEITSARHMQQFAEDHNIDLSGVEEMRDSAQAAGIPGWIVPSNYPDGDDILIGDTSMMDYVGTTELATPAGRVPTAGELERLADKLEACSPLLHGSAYVPVRQAEKLLRHLVRTDVTPLVVEGLDELVAQLRQMANTVANPSRDRMQEAATLLETLRAVEVCI